MKQILAFLLAAALCVPLAACGGKGGETPSETAEAGSVQAEVSAPANEETAPENRIALALDKNVYEKEERIEVRLDFTKLHQDAAVIVIVPSDRAHGGESAVHDDYEEYRYLADFSELPFYLWAPARDGLFDVRVYENSEGGGELASIPVAVGSAVLPASAGSADGVHHGGDSGGILTENGNCTQKQMEDTIVSYFAAVSKLTAIQLCGGESIAYSKADIPWQTVDIWTIHAPDVSYGALAASLSAQLGAAGFREESTDTGGYAWSVAAGEKSMRIELRSEDWVEGAYEIYATPVAE